MSDYPEHERLKAISDKSQAIGEFVDEFLPSKGMVLCERVPLGTDIDGKPELSLHYYPVSYSIRDLLAEFFSIDQDAIEREKRAIFDKLARNQEQALLDRVRRTEP